MTEYMEVEEQLLAENINKALLDLYRQDKYLIVHNSSGILSHVSERGIVFRFGIYFEKYLRQSSVFNQYHIDVEYNRNYDEKKKLPSFSNGAYPDLIVHKRGSNEYNLLVIEFKTWWHNNSIEDFKKIREFMAPNGQYKFRFGLSIVLNQDKAELNWERTW